VSKRIEYRINEPKVLALIGTDGDTEPSPTLTKIMASPNPEYRVQQVVNLLPFQAEVEMIGLTAGRIYFRTVNKVYAMNMSDMSMERLRSKLDATLSGR